MVKEISISDPNNLFRFIIKADNATGYFSEGGECISQIHPKTCTKSHPHPFCYRCKNKNDDCRFQVKIIMFVSNLCVLISTQYFWHNNMSDLDWLDKVKFENIIGSDLEEQSEYDEFTTNLSFNAPEQLKKEIVQEFLRLVHSQIIKC